jgi:hypothetical protein
MAAPVTFLNCRFVVEIDGTPATNFAEVILPDTHAPPAEYREGSENTARKSAGGGELRQSRTTTRRHNDQ